MATIILLNNEEFCNNLRKMHLSSISGTLKISITYVDRDKHIPLIYDLKKIVMSYINDEIEIQYNSKKKTLTTYINFSLNCNIECCNCSFNYSYLIFSQSSPKLRIIEIGDNNILRINGSITKKRELYCGHLRRYNDVNFSNFFELLYSNKNNHVQKKRSIFDEHCCFFTKVNNKNYKYMHSKEIQEYSNRNFRIFVKNEDLLIYITYIIKLIDSVMEKCFEKIDRTVKN